MSLIAQYKDQYKKRPLITVISSLFVLMILFAMIGGSKKSASNGSSGGMGSRSINQYQTTDGNTVITISLKTSDANVVMRGMSGGIPLKWTVGPGGIGLKQQDGTFFAVLSPKTDSQMKDGYPVTMVDTDGTVYNLVK